MSRLIRILKALPLPFWFYMIPMLASSAGLLPKTSPIYSFASEYLLPVCLVLLLIGTDLKSLGSMGSKAGALMLIGAAGTMAGGLISYALFKRWLPADSWGGIGALAASWTGGSANMIAVKEALQLPDSLVGPLIIVDATIAYSWMALLVASAAWQTAWQNITMAPSLAPLSSAPHRSRRPCEPSLSSAPASLSPSSFSGEPCPLGLREMRRRTPRRDAVAILISLALAISLTLMMRWVAPKLPAMAGLGASTWTIVLVTSAALLLSLTPLRALAQGGASKLGTFFLYILLATIGARASLQALAAAPAFMAMGAVWIAVHGAILLAGGFLLKAPLGLIATASQANIGGVVSAPLVGATFSDRLASLGLLMAILGNILGTYLGLLTSLIARSL